MRRDSTSRCPYDETVHVLGLDSLQRFLGVSFSWIATNSYPEWRDRSIDPRFISTCLKCRDEFIGFWLVIVRGNLHRIPVHRHASWSSRRVPQRFFSRSFRWRFFRGRPDDFRRIWSAWLL